MNAYPVLRCLLFLLLIGGLWAEQNPFKHPGMYVDGNDFAFIRQKIEAREEPWYSAFNNLQSKVSSRYTSQAVADVYEGNGSDPVVYPAVAAELFCQESQKAYDYALAWALTGKQAYADNAIHILNAWSSTLRSVTGGNSELRIGWATPYFCNAAEILRHYTVPGAGSSGWSSGDIAAFKAMLMNILYPKIKARVTQITGNNWISVIQASVMCIAVFCDDHTMFNHVVNHVVNASGQGHLPSYIYSNGQCQESGRDQNHTQMGLAGLAASAEVAWKQGVDLYSPLNNRLAAGYEYQSKYNLGYDVPFVTGGPGNRWTKISATDRGSFLTIYEMVYRHYVTRKGLAMPYTKEALTLHRRPEDRAVYGCIILSRGTLTFYRGESPLARAPSITSQPASRTVTAGQTAVFSVAASGDPSPRYQWQKNGSDISGATAARYTTPATKAGDHGSTYRCRVSNSAGSVTSKSVTLSVNTAPVVTKQPVSQTRTVGQAATFSVAATGRPTPSYQWQKNGANISGATGASYTVSAPRLEDNKATFRCVVSNSVATVTSSAAVLTVNTATPPAPTTVWRINFQTPEAYVPTGFLADTGQVFGDRGNGSSYGWKVAMTETRNRDSANAPNQAYDTLNHLHMPGGINGVWELALPNGQYDVHLVCGDPDYTDMINNVRIENKTVSDPDGNDHFDAFREVVTVSDGRLTISEASGGSNVKVCFIEVEARPASWRINFQPAQAAVPAGFLADTGAQFGDRGNGSSYGWSVAVNETRDRNNPQAENQAYDTLNHLHKVGRVNGVWELAVPNGQYEVHLVCGDPSYTDMTHNLMIENTLVTDRDGQDHYDAFTVTVTVTDGRLTIKEASGGSNVKVCFIEVTTLPSGNS